MFFSRKKKEQAVSPNETAKENFPIAITEIIQTFIQTFEQEKDAILQKALSITDFFNAQWDQYLHFWNIPIPSENARKDALNNGAAFTHGALPMELREVLIAAKEKYESQTGDIRAAYKQALTDNDEAEELLWNFEHRTLHAFIDLTLGQYIKKITPKKESAMGSIFNNAGKNQNKWSNNLKDAISYMIRCKNCGAARVHTEQYDKCKFCGSELFEKIEQ